MESDVDRVANIVEEEFILDKENSIDKRKLKSDQFGYRSLHYVVSCKKDRINLAEYKKYDELKFEIQIRSILQHAWAEIEHDLGYKGVTSIPDAYKRSFNRLAALLETADIEFDRLKKELTNYESIVAEMIEQQPENVTIDQASLISFVHSNKIIQKAYYLIRKNVGCKFIPNNDYKFLIDRFLYFFEIKTIKDLNKVLSKNEKLYLAFVNEFTQNLHLPELFESDVIFYLQHFLSALNEDHEYIQQYLNFGEIKISSVNNRFIETLIKAKTTANKKSITLKPS